MQEGPAAEVMASEVTAVGGMWPNEGTGMSEGPVSGRIAALSEGLGHRCCSRVGPLTLRGSESPLVSS